MGVYAIVYGIIRTVLMLGVAMLAFDLDRQRQLCGRAGSPGRMQHLARRFRHGRGGHAAALAGKGPAGDVHRLRGVAAGLRRLLPRSTCFPEWMQSLATRSRRSLRLEGSAPRCWTAPDRRAWGSIWPLLIMGVVFVPLGIWIFHLGESYAKRTGKLKRSG